MWAIKDNESGQIGSVEMTEAEARDWLVKFANAYGTGFGARFVPVKVS